MLAAITQTPRIALQDEQSAKLAEALANVTRHMDLPALSPQKMALAMLFWTAGSIYVPMAMDIAREKSGHIPRNAAMPVNPTNEGQTVNPSNPGGSWFMPDASVIN